MSTKTIATAAGTLAALVLVAGSALAQSSFTQAPSIPLPTGEAAPAEAPAPVVNAPPVSVAPAQPVAPQAGSTDCGSIQKTLLERKNLIAKANAASTSKQKMTPQEACSLFGKLTTNGSEGLKWITTNKEWCSIPDSFSEGFKADHLKVSGIRTKVCGIAAQAGKMEAQARAQAQNGGGGGGLLGGPGLSGSFKLPQGAL